MTDEKKAEAINEAGRFPQTIKQFEEDGSISEPRRGSVLLGRG